MKVDEILNKLKGQNIVSEISRGIERECLRVCPDGRISKKPHNKNLGAALTHPYITTDYSEALLEFVTPVYNDPKELLTFLKDLHIYTSRNIDGDILWNNSMPCFFDEDDSIPIAQYGTSNVGRMKTVYRHGLKNRYGSAMQAISGIHFNFSLSEDFLKKVQSVKKNDDDFRTFKSKSYMATTRNIHRFSWLIPYLLGSSPAISKSFLKDSLVENSLEEYDKKGTLTYEGATSLRLSNLGYTNSKQNNINICFNSLESYISNLKKAITTVDDNFLKIGLKDKDDYKQLNANMLQLENEYYAEVRPKQPINSGESPTNALIDRGIMYIELRSVDINTFSPIGIDLDQILFLDVFLLYCFLSRSDNSCPEQTAKFRQNQVKMAMHGRKDNLTLFNGSEEVHALDWAKDIFENLSEIADTLDTETGKREYTNAINNYAYKMIIPKELNSSRLMNELKQSGEPFCSNTMKRSIKFTNELRDSELSEEKIEMFKKLALKSLSDQDKIEENDDLSFEEYLKQYFSQNLRTY